jgi:hypothetical protein
MDLNVPEDSQEDRSGCDQVQTAQISLRLKSDNPTFSHFQPMKTKSINRTSTVGWSPPNISNPLVAMGSVAGALDLTFSSKTELEIFGLLL